VLHETPGSYFEEFYLIDGWFNMMDIFFDIFFTSCLSISKYIRGHRRLAFSERLWMKYQNEYFFINFFASHVSVACRGLFFFFLTKRSKSQGLQKKKLKNSRRV